MSKRLLLVSGCYDGGLVGLECTADNQSQSVQFNPLFKFLAHQVIELNLGFCQGHFDWKRNSSYGRD